jgi:hypothetical protein
MDPDAGERNSDRGFDLLPEAGLERFATAPEPVDTRRSDSGRWPPCGDGTGAALLVRVGAGVIVAALNGDAARVGRPYRPRAGAWIRGGWTRAADGRRASC